MKIRFDYEHDCGGHAYERYMDLDKKDFEEDKTLMLVCAYMQSYCGYPGPIIDLYLHNKFPNVHTLDDMLAGGCYNIYNCNVEGLKPFTEIMDGVYGIPYYESVEFVEKLCTEFNNKHKGKERENFSIWKN